MTTYFEEIRKIIYFEASAFKDIYACFDFYFNKDMVPKKMDNFDKLG